MSGGGGAAEWAPGPWAGLTGPELAARWGVAWVETWTRIGSTNDRAASLARSGMVPVTRPEPARADGSGPAPATGFGSAPATGFGPAPATGSGPTTEPGSLAPGVPGVVIAEEQTAGRGRRGRAWRSAPGSGVWLSLLVRPCPLDAALPLVVGAAASAAVESVAGAEPPVRVKWPNDLLIDGRKVGGVLCEGVAGSLVIGLGLNVSAESVSGDPSLVGIATALEVAHDKSLSRLELADAIVAGILASVSAPRPFEAVRDTLVRRDALRGRRVVSETHGAGVGAGLADDGALLIERDGERLRVVSGSVRLAPDSDPA